MGNKSLFKDKHRKKHKKEKSKKHKKDKYKKYKKEKHREKSKNSDNKNSDSDSSSSNSDASVKNETKTSHSRETEWGFLDTALSDSFMTAKNKKEKVRPLPEKPGQNIRELNPYWKDGGCGLPPPKPERREKDEKEASDSLSSGFSRDSYSKSRNEYRPEVSSDRKKLNFLKPSDSSNFEPGKNIAKGNWRKKEFKDSESTRDKETEPSESGKSECQTKSSNVISDEDLNKLAAKLVKAEIMGNTALINKLKAELEAAKKAKSESSSGAEESKGKSKEVVIVTDRTLKKSYDDKHSYPANKKQKLATHESGQRICYFPDDNKYSLKNLFEREKQTSEDDILPLSKLSSKNPEDLDDLCLDAVASNKMQKKLEERRKQRDIKEAIVKHEKLEGCPWCLDNRNATKHLIVSTGTKCYLCLPEKQSLTEGHCIIVPIQHEVSTMHLDEDVWSEIKTYQRLLTNMFLEQEQDVVFFENARSFKHFPHSFIQCVPLSKEMGELAPLYFQKAISESETEWTNNKKVIDFRQKDLHRSIPKGLPYFAITFGTSGGFAHIIEDEYLFKRNFAEEVLGGMMDLDHKRWRNKEKDDFKMQRQKTLEFLKFWKKFEFNEKSDSESSSSD